MDNEILIYAFRYAFGRMTHAPAVVARNIRALMPSMTKTDKMLWIARIEEAAQDRPVGWEWDHEVWAELYADLWKSVGVDNHKPLSTYKMTRADQHESNP